MWHTWFTLVWSSHRLTALLLIKTDLQPNNLLVGVKDEGVFTKFEQDEIDHPVPRKILGDRTIYLSRPLSLTSGPPLLCDLGEARFGDSEHTDDIMPDPYRAPEVILGMKWGYKVDIWNVAMVVRLLSSPFLIDSPFPLKRR
jgi:serine/threonine-protein kinase SRPK3